MEEASVRYKRNNSSFDSSSFASSEHSCLRGLVNLDTLLCLLMCIFKNAALHRRK